MRLVPMAPCLVCASRNHTLYVCEIIICVAFPRDKCVFLSSILRIVFESQLRNRRSVSRENACRSFRAEHK